MALTQISFLKFRQWSKFHVNVISVFGVMIIFIYNEFDQKNKKIENTHIWILSNIRCLDCIKDTSLELVSLELGKCLSVCLRTKWLWIQIPLQSLTLAVESNCVTESC